MLVAMRHRARQAVRRARRRIGAAIDPDRHAPTSGRPGAHGQPEVLAGADADDLTIVEAARPYTMTPSERILANIDAVDHVLDRDVPGALVECGVWRGGSVLSMVLTLLRRGVIDRDVYLYDTFEGMTAPGDDDVSRFDVPARETWDRARQAGRTAWDFLFRPETFGLDHVRAVLEGSGYPMERIHFVVGPVEDTIPATVPERIAVLRLDTDWYESTRHEMDHLYPRLETGGVLIIDDYGHWDGARRAVDEHLADAGASLLLSRVDYSARMGVKR